MHSNTQISIRHVIFEIYFNVITLKGLMIQANPRKNWVINTLQVSVFENYEKLWSHIFRLRIK